MSIERNYISTNLFGQQGNPPYAGDNLANNRGYYYNLSNLGGPTDGEFIKKPPSKVKIDVLFGEASLQDEDLGGCFDFNDIYRIYPVKIRSEVFMKDQVGKDHDEPHTADNKNIVLWTDMIFGEGAEKQIEPLIEVETPNGTQLIPYGSDGLIPKRLFNTRYYDHSFKQILPAPPSIAVKNQDALGNTSPSKDLSSLYSFFIPEYESFAANNPGNYNETAFPYIYNFIDEIHNSNLNDLFSSLDQTKMFFWNDPKCNIFLGGSNTPSMQTKTQEGLYWIQNRNLQNQFVNYAPSIKEPFNDIAQFEKRMLGSLLGDGEGSGIDTLYEGQYKKSKDSALKKYFMKWSIEATGPSEPVVMEELKPSTQPYTVEMTKDIRKNLEHKYKNIFFRQSELMDYSHTQKIFPMSTRIKIENIPNINSGVGWQKCVHVGNSFKRLFKEYNFYENIFDKLADTTAQPFYKSTWMNLPDKAIKETEFGYNPEHLYPRVLDKDEEYYDSITNFTPVDYNKTTDKKTLELPFNAKVIDFKEFIKEFKDPSGDFIYHEDDGYKGYLGDQKEIRQAIVGVNKEMGAGDEFIEGIITNPAAVLDEIDPNYSPTNPLLADYFSQDIYDFVRHIFNLTVMQQFHYAVDGPVILPEDPHAQFKAYNEVIGVRLSKHELDETTGMPKEKPIQNIYFPNSSDLNDPRYPWSIDYIDTHVKYGKKYFYKAHLITVVVGKKYFYRNLTAPEVVDAGNKKYFESTMEMVTEPSVIITEVPYSELGTTLVLSPPPLPPIAEFIASGQNPGFVKILLLNDNNSGLRVPIPIEEADKEYYASVLQSQNPKEENAGKIYFKSDDDVAGYRIYKLDVKPTVLSDFANAYTNLSTDLDATHYNDVLLLNQKYYYIFRTIDAHGGPSNPSHIYEIELVSLSDGTSDVAIYPVIKVYSIDEFFKGEAFPNKKSFRRYIHIKPSRNQSDLSSLEKLLSDDSYKLNFTDPDTGEMLKEFKDEWNKYSENYSIKKNEFPTFGSYAPESRFIIGSKIGPDVSTLKNRKIKIRLTSKSTGRKIDLNLNFKHTHFPFDPSHADKNENVPDQDDN